MNKILITGATGFIGRYLQSYFTSKNIVHTALNLRLEGSQQIKSDVNCIVHLAGKAHDIKNVSHYKEYYHINYQLTKNVYDAFLKSEAKKFIFISTVKAVADHLDCSLIEDVIPNPQTHYGKSKLMAEEYIKAQPLPSGKSYYILRPCMIHGPGNKGNLNRLYNFVSKGLPYPLAAFENKRSFLSVENLCFIIKELVERDDIPGGIYNVADDEALSTNDVVTFISKSINKPLRLLAIPEKLITFLAGIGDKLKLPLNTERLGKLTDNYIVNNTKIKNVLQKELPLSSFEGLIRTIQSFHTNLNEVNI